tara:strand:+ start:689 stop:1477 length:789 start_codon:yes stop_codon:yes gene_type:complete
MQILTQAYELGFLSNNHCKYFGSPSIFEKIFKYKREKYISNNYKSEFGNIVESNSPSECGEFWYRFFPRVSCENKVFQINEKKMIKFRRSIHFFSKSLNKPLIFKNLYNSLRIKEILTYIPEAVFIVINRDEIQNAYSILSARMIKNGNYSDWWSVPPPGIAYVKNIDPSIQVVEQIRKINKLINNDLSEYDKKIVHHIKYEDLCTDVYNELTRLNRFFKNNKIYIKNNNSVPKKFNISMNKLKDEELVEKIIRYSKNKNDE